MKKLKGPHSIGIVNENFEGDDGIKNNQPGFVEESFVDARVEEKDAFANVELEEEDFSGPLWSELSGAEKAKRIAINLCKVTILIGLLYFFICSLDLLGSSFRLLAGKTAGQIFQSNTILNNPVAALMVGVLVTVLLQSSSTSTSIIVAMVGSKILKVQQAVYIIMGANIGTSVTSTIVAMSQAGDKEIFRRAFAGGTVHDMFNWLTVLILLPLEAATGYLYLTTEAITNSTGNSSRLDVNTGQMQFLQAATRPFTNLIIQVDEKGIEKFAENPNYNLTTLVLTKCATTVTRYSPDTTAGTSVSEIIPCRHLFMGTSLLDWETGLILLFVALTVICGSLILLVKILSGLLKGSVSTIIKKVVNYDFPFPFGFLTGYIAMIAGAGLTVIVQSSSVFTSTLTPLVGLGIISIERVYPLTLGSNVGTTATSLLAALSSSAETFQDALQTSLVHLFFNVSGVLLWYVIPFMRAVPIGAAKVLGNTTAQYRWFALVYILLFFLLLPGFVFLLSWLGWIYLAAIGGPLLTLLIIIVVINVIQTEKPKFLPPGLRDWDWLPLWMHSLDPMDNVMRKVLRLFPCCRTISPASSESRQQYAENLVSESANASLGKQSRYSETTFSVKSDYVEEDKNIKLLTAAPL